MKKFCFSLLFLFFITGCNSKSLKTMVCTRKDSVNGLELDFSYTVDYVGNDVTMINSVEKITSSDSNKLNQYMDSVLSVYSPYKDVDYYDTDVYIEGNTLISKSSIDYSNIDTDKMLEINASNGQLIKNGKVDIDTLRSYYSSLGISCK